jgi:hypothetical protein
MKPALLIARGGDAFVKNTQIQKGSGINKLTHDVYMFKSAIGEHHAGKAVFKISAIAIIASV